MDGAGRPPSGRGLRVRAVKRPLAAQGGPRTVESDVSGASRRPSPLSGPVATRRADQTTAVVQRTGWRCARPRRHAVAPVPPTTAAPVVGPRATLLRPSGEKLELVLLAGYRVKRLCPRTLLGRKPRLRCAVEQFPCSWWRSAGVVGRGADECASECEFRSGPDGARELRQRFLR